MMASIIAGMAGYVGMVLAAVFIAVMVFIHRRGGARVCGVIGAVLLITGTVARPILVSLGIGSSGNGLFAVDDPSSLSTLIALAAPGTLLGVGLILVFIAAVSRAPRKAVRQ